MSVLLAVLLAAVTGAAPGPPGDAGFKLVVNSANPATSISRDEVSRLFLKKAPWADGRAALPVDKKTDDPVRRAFSKAVLAKEPTEVVAYWNQIIFSGRGVPPPSKSTDEEVQAFVRGNAAAIGYVGPESALVEGVKVLKLRD